MDSTLKFWILCLVRAVCLILDRVIDSLCGTSFLRGSRIERLEAEDYEKSAQIVNIIWRAKLALFRVTRKNCFIYKHDRYVHPEYVLSSVNVTLMAVEKYYVLFAVTDPNMNIFDSSKFPFLFLTQFFQSKQLVIMPIKSFHRLANELGDPKVPVAMMAMTTRCGSTLLTQMFNRVPGVRAYSELWATGNIHELRCTGNITPEESRRLLKSAIRLQCKLEPNSGVERIFLKMTVLHAPQMLDFHALFPQFIYFFNTRHPVPSLKSLKKVSGPFKYNLYMLLGIRWREQVQMNFAISYNSKYRHLYAGCNKYIPDYNLDFWSLFLYSMAVLPYFENKNMFDLVVLYEKLTEDPKDELQKMFDVFGISHKHIPKALGALKKDSQNGTWGIRGGGHLLTLDPELLNAFDKRMERIGVPLRHDTSEREFRAIFGH